MSDLITTQFITQQDIIESCIEDCFEGYKDLANELCDIFEEYRIFVRPNLYDMTTKSIEKKWIYPNSYNGVVEILRALLRKFLMYN